jgi:hypothetical protein
MGVCGKVSAFETRRNTPSKFFSRKPATILLTPNPFIDRPKAVEKRPSYMRFASVKYKEFSPSPLAGM